MLKNFENTTIQQHYLSQAEQRLNAINPNAKPKNQRILQYRAIDRDTLSVDSPKSVKIVGNLMMNDLFSFDLVTGSRLRANLESLFRDYEKDVVKHTISLRRALARKDTQTLPQVPRLFQAKMLSMFRNPFNIREALSLLPDLTQFHPTDPQLYQTYLRVASGRKPQQDYLIEQLGITDREYDRWLRSLFFLLQPMLPGQPNLYEQILHGICRDRERFLMVHVFTFSSRVCLLSDKGYIYFTDDDDVHQAWCFNLDSYSFITYSFSEIDQFYFNYEGPKPYIPDGGREQVKTILNEEPTPVRGFRDRMDVLRTYNQRVLRQCHEHVYSGSQDWESFVE